MTKRGKDLDAELQAAFPLTKQEFSKEIVLRPLRQSDLEQLTSILGDDTSMTWTRRRWDVSNVEYLLGLRLAHYEKHGFGVYGVVSQSSDLLIGMAGLQYWDDDGEDVEAIAYIDKSRWNQGLASSTLLWCKDRAFDQCASLKRIVAATRHDNTAAQAVARSLGMEVIGEDEHYGARAMTWAVYK